ncbi:unnamed protein product [Brassica rapa]|uniref:Uncharacterized protein n=1 Tax=Brassica campestris TaxID=3711 RepID=A0A8D9GX15_BRACM|nr:unnamed protein product [Brassica rapa]
MAVHSSPYLFKAIQSPRIILSAKYPEKEEADLSKIENPHRKISPFRVLHSVDSAVLRVGFVLLSSSLRRLIFGNHGYTRDINGC